MVKTLKPGDVVWRFDGKPMPYTVGHADDDIGCATLVEADGHKVWLADYSCLW